jgi:hypothetical protein
MTGSPLFYTGKMWLKILLDIKGQCMTIRAPIRFEQHSTADANFLETLHSLIEEESRILYDELFVDTTLEVGKNLSKSQREDMQLREVKSLIYGEVDYPSFYRVLRKLHARPVRRN